jgi:hypothetical protein
MALGRIDFDGGRSITRAIGLDFFGAQMELASLVAISGPKKVYIFRANLFQWALRLPFQHSSVFFNTSKMVLHNTPAGT